MRKAKYLFMLIVSMAFVLSCTNGTKGRQTASHSNPKKVTAQDILGNPDFLAISYGGYRKGTRDVQPTVSEIKEDLKILHAMGIRILRTYNVQLDHAPNVLRAIRQLKTDDPSFTMYVMLGAWIDCLDAWSAKPNHEAESPENAGEIARAVALAQQYPDIVKILAVGNEAMVKWAGAYYVQPNVILKWVNHLQDLKKNGNLDADLWITSSDNFASWGGGDALYHVTALNELIFAVDYLSVHTYPMHDTHYNPDFWGVFGQESEQPKLDQIDAAMLRSQQYAQAQVDSVKQYVKSLGVNKPIHIGETGWASASNGFYGDKGSRATDEYKEGLYYNLMREYTRKEGMACFYFEAFDEQWKDAQNPKGSENHFGLFTIDGRAKFALWELVDQNVFKGLGRAGNPVHKTYNGDKGRLLKEVKSPPKKEN